LRIVKLYKYLCSEHKEYVLSKQVLRSDTAVGGVGGWGRAWSIKSRFYKQIKHRT